MQIKENLEIIKIDYSKNYYNNITQDITLGVDAGSKVIGISVTSKKEELDKQVNMLYEQSKTLFEEREKEANMIGEINNVISAKKNLKANIGKLDNEIQKQGELVYNVDFQIQLMERKVDWVMGKRTQEETKEINKKTEILEKNVSDLQKSKNKIDKSLGQIEEDLTGVITKTSSVVTSSLMQPSMAFIAGYILSVAINKSTKRFISGRIRL